MTDKCKHVSRFNLGDNHSILNPQKWICAECESTESVWACLNCFHVGCGRFNQEHAVNHFKESTHPIAIEVNEKYVYCYVCDDYVLNDNAAGEIKLLRTMLSAIASQSFENLEGRSTRFMRSAFSSSSDSESAESVLRDADKTFTAFRHRRLTLLQKTFLAWRAYARYMKELSTTLTPPKEVAAPISPKRKQVFTQGVTGLRNLGNTCYMNSIIQVLGHIPEFREFFINMEVSHCNVYTRKPNKQNKIKKNSLPENNVHEHGYARQTTMEAKQHVEHKDNESNKNKPENNSAKQHRRKQGGLNGGSSPSINTGIQKMQVEVKDVETVSLCHELHDLFRVLWSGKWAIVSPHSMLHAVWKAIPSFKGFAQQDAQEFLCELIERVHTELTSSLPQRRFTEKLNRNCPRGWVYVPVTTANQKCAHHTVVTEIFQGELVSEVSCIACGHKSHTYEPFWDLSLEFPDRYNILNSPDSTFSEESCDLTEMLAKFTEKESLEGDVYACDQCNSRRRSTSKKPLTYTSAYKSLMVHRLPKVLRLHLKRFRWAGRLHREKIKVHVNFKHKLNVQSYCNPASPEQSFDYELSGAIIHHGRGFGSGHYTCYCWNSNADSWIQCNDGRLEPYSEVDILSCQAYILFYSRTKPAHKQASDVILTQPQETMLTNSDTNLTSRDDPSSEEDEEVTFKTPFKRQLYSSDDLDITKNDDGFRNEVKKQRTSI